MDKHGYARRNLGGGNTLKAVTRTRRAGRHLGRAPGKMPGPARWRAYERQLMEARLTELLDEAVDDSQG